LSKCKSLEEETDELLNIVTDLIILLKQQEKQEKLKNKKTEIKTNIKTEIKEKRINAT
jgi:hypothetical protein